ncbi:MAG: AAA family ATPase [bacterium]|nr:AAA family ATPase [bacterium]
MNKNFIISGISGVGKDFTLNELAQSDHFEFTNLHAGSFIKESFKNHPENDSEENIDLAFDKIRERMNRNLGRTALNCHLIYGLYPNLMSNLNRLSSIPHEKIIVIKKSPETIIKQRLQDSERQRPAQSIEDIASTQKEILQTAKKLAKTANSLLKIYNPDLEKIDNLRDFLE